MPASKRTEFLEVGWTKILEKAGNSRTVISDSEDGGQFWFSEHRKTQKK